MIFICTEQSLLVYRIIFEQYNNEFGGAEWTGGVVDSLEVGEIVSVKEMV